MGLLFKIVIITVLLLYVITKVGSFVFRNVVWLMGNESVSRQKQAQEQPGQRRQYRNHGNVRVDNASSPNGQRRSASRHDSEYVDYEEVK